MAITEQQSFEMHLELRKHLGDDVASTLMEYLPPSGWGDVARVHDLQALGDRLDARIDRVESRIDRVELRMDSLDSRIKSLSGGFKVMIASVLTVGLGLFALQVQILLSVSRL